MHGESETYCGIYVELSASSEIFCLQPVRSGPVSNLKNVNASKKQKRFAKGSKADKKSESLSVSPSNERPQALRSKQKQKKDSSTLDDINPYVIGQRSR